MGILDRFAPRRPPRGTAGPPTGSGAAHDFGLPARGRIETYVIADAVGTLRLASGAQLKFGRSGCQDFEPVVGAGVIVEQASSGARGPRATAIRLDPDLDDYDALLEARDEQRGISSRRRAPEEIADEARQIRLVTVLMKDRVPDGTLATRRWAKERGLTRHGIDVRRERELEFRMAHDTVISGATSNGRFPGDVDARNLPDDFDWGAAFVSLGSQLPGFERQQRALIHPEGLDLWAMGGRMRSLSRLVLRLLEHGTGVVLHRACELVVPAEDFARMLGDLDDPECVPFGAWLDFALTSGDGETLYATLGMDAFGLPDVIATVDADDEDDYLRRQEAVLLACHRMVREDRELEAGETLQVPVGVRIGAWPIEAEPDAPVLTYTVLEAGELLRLEPISA